MYKDLLWALRWLRKNPLFTTAVTLVLALGVGANTAVFSIVDAVLLRPLPYESAGRLVRVEGTALKRPITGVPAPEFLRWRDRHDIFATAVPWLRDTVTITGGGDPDQVVALRASGDLFPMLGARARLGRALVDTDDAPGSVRAVVISDRLWRRRYHADPTVIGTTITISDDVYTIAGVMPPDFEFPISQCEIWIPYRPTPASAEWLHVVARLQPHVTVAQAQSALRIVAKQLEQEDPQKRAGLKFDVSPWSEMPDGKYELTVLFVLAAVGLVLLIACADVGSLLLSRAVERQKEIAIRAALGAGFGRVLRQLLAESLVLAAAGSAMGVVLARILLQFLTDELAALPIVLPHLQRVSLNGRVLAFSAALCLLMTLLCGLAPVLLAKRIDVQSVLRGNSSRGSGHSARLFSMLIASESALAFLLLVSSGLMIRSLVRLQQDDHGFRPDHVLTLRVPVGAQALHHPGKHDTKPLQMAYLRQVLDSVRGIPGIRSAAVVNNLPLSGVNAATVLPGQDGKDLLVSTRCISPQYFDAHARPCPAALLCEARAHVIHQYVSHRTRSHSHEMRFVLPRLACESKPRLVHEQRRLQARLRPPPREVKRSQFSQLRIDALQVCFRDRSGPAHKFALSMILAARLLRVSLDGKFFRAGWPGICQRTPV